MIQAFNGFNRIKATNSLLLKLKLKENGLCGYFRNEIELTPALVLIYHFLSLKSMAILDLCSTVVPLF
jgi:hypothetical protein